MKLKTKIKSIEEEKKKGRCSDHVREGEVGRGMATTDQPEMDFCLGLKNTEAEKEKLTVVGL